MTNRVTPPDGSHLADYLSDVIGDVDNLRELVARTEDCVIPATLGALLRLARAQLSGIVAAVQRDVGDLYVHYDGVVVTVELRRCANGKTHRCCCCRDVQG